MDIPKTWWIISLEKKVSREEKVVFQLFGMKILDSENILKNLRIKVAY